MVEEANNFITHDLGFAAFLKLRKFELLQAFKEGPLFNFKFKDPGNNCYNLRLEYINSELAKFDAEVKGLKKLMSI